MNKYIATVIKTGNSFALRVPKGYVDDASLKLGQKVHMAPPILSQDKQDSAAIQRAIKGLQHLFALTSISDPIAWQKELRTDRKIPGRS